MDESEMVQGPQIDGSIIIQFVGKLDQYQPIQLGDDLELCPVFEAKSNVVSLVHNGRYVIQSRKTGFATSEIQTGMSEEQQPSVKRKLEEEDLQPSTSKRMATSASPLKMSENLLYLNNSSNVNPIASPSAMMEPKVSNLLEEKLEDVHQGSNEGLDAEVVENAVSVMDFGDLIQFGNILNNNNENSAPNDVQNLKEEGQESAVNVGNYHGGRVYRHPNLGWIRESWWEQPPARTEFSELLCCRDHFRFLFFLIMRKFKTKQHPTRFTAEMIRIVMDKLGYDRNVKYGCYNVMRGLKDRFQKQTLDEGNAEFQEKLDDAELFNKYEAAAVKIFSGLPV